MLVLYLVSSVVENDRRALNIKQGLRKARQEGRWPGPARKATQRQEPFLVYNFARLAVPCLYDINSAIQFVAQS